MTPQEKAKELIEWFFKLIPQPNTISEVDGVKFEIWDKKWTLNEAKQCAIKVCDEMQMGVPMYVGVLNPKWEYWGQVKTAINNYEQ